MGIKIIAWHEADLEALRELYCNYPYPPYFGSHVVDDRMQTYRFNKICKIADTNPETFSVAVLNDRPFCAAQLQRVDHLSNRLGVEIGTLTNEAFVPEISEMTYRCSLMLISAFRDLAEKQRFLFLTTSVASQALHWIRALEGVGFRYADGFRHVVEDIKDNYDDFLIDNLIIRDFTASDYEEILYSFTNMPFPSYLLYEPEFDKGLVMQLYANRYREVHEKGLGRVFVGEMDGKFMGALNGIIDRDILRELGVVVNHVSQGLIIHPRAAGKGIAIGLVAFRHNWYREQGMQYGYLGSNINNIAMIRGLEKIKAKHAGIEMSFMLRLRHDEPQ